MLRVVKENLCSACNKRVYFMDKISLDGVDYHEICAKCVECSKKLNQNSFYTFEKRLYCKPHYNQIIKKPEKKNRESARKSPSRFPSVPSSPLSPTFPASSSASTPITPFQKGPSHRLSVTKPISPSPRSQTPQHPREDIKTPPPQSLAPQYITSIELDLLRISTPSQPSAPPSSLPQTTAPQYRTSIDPEPSIETQLSQPDLPSSLPQTTAPQYQTSIESDLLRSVETQPPQSDLLRSVETQPPQSGLPSSRPHTTAPEYETVIEPDLLETQPPPPQTAPPSSLPHTTASQTIIETEPQNTTQQGSQPSPGGEIQYSDLVKFIDPDYLALFEPESPTLSPESPSKPLQDSSNSRYSLLIEPQYQESPPHQQPKSSSGSQYQSLIDSGPISHSLQNSFYLLPEDTNLYDHGDPSTVIPDDYSIVLPPDPNALTSTQLPEARYKPHIKNFFVHKLFNPTANVDGVPHILKWVSESADFEIEPFNLRLIEGIVEPPKECNFILSTAPDSDGLTCPFWISHVVSIIPYPSRSQPVPNSIALFASNERFTQEEYDFITDLTYDKYKSSKMEKTHPVMNNSCLVVLEAEKPDTLCELETPLTGMFLLIKLISGTEEPLQIQLINFIGTHPELYSRVPSPSHYNPQDAIDAAFQSYDSRNEMTTKASKLQLKVSRRHLNNATDALAEYCQKSVFPEQILNEFERHYRPDQAVLPFSYYGGLPEDIKKSVFSYVDLETKALCSTVCKNWRQWITNVYPLDWIKLSFKLLKHFCYKFSKISESYLLMLKQRESFVNLHKKQLSKNSPVQINVNEKGRVNYLQETINDFKTILFQSEYFSDMETPSNYIKQESDMKMLKSFTKLTDIFKDILFDSLKVYTEIFIGEKQMNSNFDMIELTIRRYFLQLSKMFLEPYHKNLPVLFSPEQVIEDPAARESWVNMFGNGTYWVEFKEFESKFLENSGFSKDTRNAIEVITHFPANGCITTYAFHLLSCHWGPYNDIQSNINRYALAKGFLGLVNSYAATEQINEFQDIVYMIRFSRAEPELLTFSWGSSKKSVTHHRKPKHQSISAFMLKNKLQHFSPIPFYYLWGLAKDNSTTVSHYSTYEGGYTCGTNHS